MMVKPFEDAVFSAKKGDIVGPVESDCGWHVIYVTDIHPVSYTHLDVYKRQPLSLPWRSIR